MSFGQMSKYDIWSGVEIYHKDFAGDPLLVRCRNESFGHTSKYDISSGVEIYHMDFAGEPASKI